MKLLLDSIAVPPQAGGSTATGRQTRPGPKQHLA
jgi:hypothetical protein